MADSTPTIINADNEPRIRDVDLAKELGMADVCFMRKSLIEANREELEAHGSLCSVPIKPGPRGGRPGRMFYLNQAQTLNLCLLSKAPKAKKVRVQMIRVFMAWRRGGLERVQPEQQKATRTELWPILGDAA